MINWIKGLSVETYVMEVDAESWKDVDRIEILGGSIARTDEGLRNAADLECKDYDQTRERWVRIYLDARQSGIGEHKALFTGLASAPDRDIYGVVNNNRVVCSSVLQPCSDIFLPRGWYAPAGANAATVLRDLLSATPAPVEVEGETPKLLNHIVAEEGETRLTMVDKILLAIGWRLQILGDGTIRISEPPNAPLMIFDPSKNDCIETDLTVSYDWYSAPNVIRATTDTASVTYKDMSDAPFSVSNRGREIWVEETDCNLNDGETLESYAIRRLKELQMVQYGVSYRRRFIPDIYTTDLVELHYPAQKIDGIFYISSQNITLGYGATTSEEVIAWTK